MIAVSDDGCGMNSETQVRLFEPFFTTKELGKGTGLGLATVYGIVRQNNGMINVYSEPGKGTTFKIYLPMDASELPAALEVEDKPTASGGETILLVEDELAILKLTTKILEKSLYQVLPASSPAQAIELAQKHAGPIHLLLTDMVMPEMNGRELSEKIMAIRPEIKTIFMSGYTADIIARQGVIEEGAHFLQKPVTAQSLAAKISKALA